MSEGLIQFDDQDLVNLNDHIVKIERFNQLVSDYISRNSIDLRNIGYINNGTDCEILKLGDSQWRKGTLKLRLIVEFIPDEVESEGLSDSDSSLDQIRQTMNEVE